MKTRVITLAALLAMASVMACGCSDENSGTSSTTTSEASVETSVEASAEDNSGDSKADDQSSAEESKKVTPGTPVDSSWFDDSVFVGDSVTLKLSYYAEDHDDLSKAEFLCAGSLGYNNALWELDHEDEVHPVYNGTKYTVDEGVKVIGAKKVFIMLGMNDIGLYGVDGAAEGMVELTDRIKAKNPDAELYVQSVTPMIADFELGALNNTVIYEFDEKLEEICKEKGYKYLNVASAVCDENGNLKAEYCSDPDAMGLHFTSEGCEKWIEYLKTAVTE